MLFDQNKLTILCTIARLAVVILKRKYDKNLNLITRKCSSTKTYTYLGDSPPHVSSLPWIPQLQPHSPLFLQTKILSESTNKIKDIVVVPLLSVDLV
jgi:hypothetical protein